MSGPGGRRTIEVEDVDGRYHRQGLITWWDQERLANARVIVVGAGALGNEIVKNLALMGVGHLTVVDMDHIENSNLARCVFFREEDEGANKAEVLADRAGEMNEDIEVVPIVGDVRVSLGLGAFREADLVVGGLDNREARLYVNQACWKTVTPWIDGAIEGLMGIVRVFVPPETACYECTMSERDHQLVSARKSCALLSRDEMLEGKVPTNSTSASVVGGIQAQEAVKLLHADVLGQPDLAGKGFNFVGSTHDSYLVAYQPREDCLSHDFYDLDQAEVFPAEVSFEALLERARELLGSEAVLELEHEIAVEGHCDGCQVNRAFMRPIDGLKVAEGLCPNCGNPMNLQFVHSVDQDSPLLFNSARDIGLPPQDVIVGRDGFERVFFQLEEPVGSKEAEV